MSFDLNYAFDLGQNARSIIKVIGVGGGGSNAVNFMYNQGIKDVEFVVVNTDAQALKNSPVPNKLQIGKGLTEGLGAGANPDKGRAAAMESVEEIKEMLKDDTKMVFITAGMGGGTGTGAAPVIAEVAKEMGILTVGIVTAPFKFEGPKKRQQAEAGMTDMKRNCDTLLVILNDKLREMFGNMTMTDAYSQADNILATAAKGIAEIITQTGQVNVDFEDVKTVMKEAGTAVMGSAQTSGDGRAMRAAKEAISSPLLNSRDILGAKRILLSIISGPDSEIRMDEFEDITCFIQEAAGEDAEMIYGHTVDENLGEQLRVTIIATGFDKLEAEVPSRPLQIAAELDAPMVVDLDRTQASKPIDLSVTSKPLHSGPEHTNLTINTRPEPAQRHPEPVYNQLQNQPQLPLQQPAYTPPPAAPQPQPYQAPLFPQPEPRAVNPAPAGQNFPPVPGFFDKSRQTPLNSPAARTPAPIHHDEAEAARKRQTLLEQSEERRRRLRQMGHRPQDVDITRLDEPAYMRQNLVLQDPVQSDQSQISRYSLSDESDLMGNNKFLHDNVD